MRFSVSCGSGNGSIVPAEIASLKLSQRNSAKMIVAYYFNIALLSLSMSEDVSDNGET